MSGKPLKRGTWEDIPEEIRKHYERRFVLGVKYNHLQVIIKTTYDKMVDHWFRPIGDSNWLFRCKDVA